MRISKWLIVGLAVGAIALGAVACSSNKKSSSSPTDTPSAETPSSTQSTTPAPTGSGTTTGTPSAFSTVVASQNATLGTILTTYDGFTVYTFDNDTAGTSNCVDACATLWPPLPSAGQPTAGAGVTGTLGLTARPDGSQQVTYNGKPLYYFSNDNAAGDAKGDGFANGIWHVVKLS